MGLYSALSTMIKHNIGPTKMPYYEIMKSGILFLWIVSVAVNYMMS